MHLLHELQSGRKFTDLLTTRQDFEEINCLSVFHQQLKVNILLVLYLYTFMSMSIIYMCLLVCLSSFLISLFIPPFIHPSTHLSTHQSIPLSIFPAIYSLSSIDLSYIHPFIYPYHSTIYPFIYPSNHPSHNHQFIHPSIQTQTESSKHYMFPFMQMKEQKNPLNTLYQQVKTAMLNIHDTEGSQAAVDALLKVAKDW